MITIVLQGGEYNYGVVGRPEAEDALAALDKVRSDILLAVASQQAQQEPMGEQQSLASEDLDAVKAAAEDLDVHTDEPETGLDE